jgi:prepilin-type N-terminal cleavage/methylation domain-containing protein
MWGITMLHRLRKTQEEREGGFTLIELLIVIVVLGILAGIVVFGVGTFRADSQAAACRADLKTVSVAADAFDARNGTYPADIGDLVPGAPATGGSYLKTVPVGAWTFVAATQTVTRAPVC